MLDTYLGSMVRERVVVHVTLQRLRTRSVYSNSRGNLSAATKFSAGFCGSGLVFVTYALQHFCVHSAYLAATGLNNIGGKKPISTYRNSIHLESIPG